MESNHLPATLLINDYRVTAGNREHTTYLVDSNGFEPLRFLQNGFTVRRLQPLGQLSLIVNTLSSYAVYSSKEWRMCVLKHSTWMNPLALRPENALIRNHFFIHTRISHPVRRPFGTCFKCVPRASFP